MGSKGMILFALVGGHLRGANRQHGEHLEKTHLLGARRRDGASTPSLRSGPTLAGGRGRAGGRLASAGLGRGVLPQVRAVSRLPAVR